MKKVLIGVFMSTVLSLSLFATYIPGTINRVIVKSDGLVYVDLKKTDDSITGLYTLAGSGDAFKAFYAAILSAQAQDANVELNINDDSPRHWDRIRILK